MNCTRCENRDRETSATEDEYGNVLCDDCRDIEAEAAHERKLESPGVSISELSDRAYRERAELRRRD